jgi:hypothetical protein
MPNAIGPGRPAQRRQGGSNRLLRAAVYHEEPIIQKKIARERKSWGWTVHWPVREGRRCSRVPAARRPWPIDGRPLLRGRRDGLAADTSSSPSNWRRVRRLSLAVSNRHGPGKTHAPHARTRMYTGRCGPQGGLSSNLMADDGPPIDWPPAARCCCSGSSSLASWCRVVKHARRGGRCLVLRHASRANQRLTCAHRLPGGARYQAWLWEVRGLVVVRPVKSDSRFGFLHARHRAWGWPFMGLVLCFVCC